MFEVLENFIKMMDIYSCRILINQKLKLIYLMVLCPCLFSDIRFYHFTDNLQVGSCFLHFSLKLFYFTENCIGMDASEGNKKLALSRWNFS